jgi:hypothetical protein
MMTKAVIIEQVDADGTLRSFRMKPAEGNEDIDFAYPDKFDADRSGPFHFLDEADEERFSRGFAVCRARKMGKTSWTRDGNNFHLELAWTGIPTKSDYHSFYVLSLPEYGVPLQLSITDPHTPGREYQRYVTRDKKRRRYVIYLGCSSQFGTFDFELRCDAKIDELGFDNSSYRDAHLRLRPTQRSEEGRSWLERDDRVQQFFIGNLQVGSRFDVAQAGAVGSNASAQDSRFFNNSKSAPKLNLKRTELCSAFPLDGHSNKPPGAS